MSPTNKSLIPSILPQRVFSDDEDAFFEDLVDEAEIDAIVAALFPDSLTKPTQA
jgi:hypothetical protein